MSKNPTQSNKLKTPKLRFPGFDGVWEEKKLGEVAKFFSGGTPSSSSKKYYNGTIPFIKSGEISKEKTEQFINEVALKDSSAKLVESGDLLYALYGATSGEVAISKISGAINQAVLCIRTEQNKNWLFNYLDFQKEKILSRYLQGGQGNLSADIIKNLKISFPQLPEQQKIASFLSGVDAWVENLREQKKSLESYKKSLMQKIFSQEIRFKDENGNDFPEWEEKRLGEVCEMKNGYTFESSNYDNNGKYKIITIGNVQNGFLSLDKTNCISILPKDIQRHQILNISDLLISMTGNVGRVCLVNEENCLLNQRVGKIVSNSSLVNNDFIYQKLNTKEFEFKMQSLAQGGAQGNISKGDILGFKLQVPSIPEQQKIAEFLSSIDTLLESKQQQITKAEEWKKGLMQNLFV